MTLFNNTIHEQSPLIYANAEFTSAARSRAVMPHFGASLDIDEAFIEENWEGCCEDPIDDDYYDRTLKEPCEDQQADWAHCRSELSVSAETGAFLQIRIKKGMTNED